MSFILRLDEFMKSSFFHLMFYVYINVPIIKRTCVEQLFKRLMAVIIGHMNLLSMRYINHSMLFLLMFKTVLSYFLW